MKNLSALDKIRLAYKNKRDFPECMVDFARIEFNEDQQSFHIEMLTLNGNPRSAHQENTHGWSTIGIAAEYVCSLFISNSECMDGPITLNRVKDNWEYHIERLAECYNPTNNSKQIIDIIVKSVEKK